MTRLALVTNDLVPYGSQRVTLTLATALARRAEVVLVTLDRWSGGSKTEIEGILNLFSWFGHFQVGSRNAPLS